MPQLPSVDPAPVPDSRRQAANAATTALLGLVDDLIVVIEAENALMATGVPASTSHLVERKRQLAGQFSNWIAGLRSRKIEVVHADSALRQRLIESNAVLRLHMNDNVESLQASIAATRRRIDAIMRAIREQSAAPPARYGADGKVAPSQAAQAIRPGRYL
jgi:hypothetical protein